MARPAVYVAQLLSIALTLIVLAGAICYVIDPYGLNENFMITTVNRLKPETETHERLYKASVISKRHPTILALGTSRVQRGITMSHPAWGGNIEDRYNAGLVGANMYETLKYFEHANNTRQLKRVVIGLDLLAFNYYKLNQADFDEQLLSVDHQDMSVDATLHRAKTYFSLSTLHAVKTTLDGNCTNCFSPILPDGQENPKVFEKALDEFGGHYALFFRNDGVAVSLLHFPPPSHKFALLGPNGESQFPYLQRLIEIARRDHIDLRLFISPCHARQWEALRAAGLWPEFERWKEMLVKILAEDSARHPTEPAFPLWDFSGYNSISTEPVPVAGDTRTQMKWYWESSHYKTAVGNFVLNRIFNYRQRDSYYQNESEGIATSCRTNCTTCADTLCEMHFGSASKQDEIPPDFGVQLTQHNLTGHQSAILADGERYRLTHQQDVALLDQLASQAMADRESRLQRSHSHERTLPHHGITAQKTNGQRSRFAIHY
ncbi:MAG: hypothetical protein V4568_00325 [Pseudomonadota bacterium]